MARVWDDYGAGAHQWPYWARDLRETLPDLMATFAAPPPAPAKVTYTAVEPGYEAYGWQVAMQRPALEFSTLSDATRTGFSLTGSGSSLVTTPPIDRPGQLAAVTVTSSSATTTGRLSADGHGRLQISVPLGPPNPAQEDAPGSSTRVFRTLVVIAPTRAASAHRKR
jgi:hypothetical protein